jgi:hypothetical protein
MEAEKIPKKSPKYNCECCYYSTGNKKDYTKHLSTRKHHYAAEGNDGNNKILKNSPNANSDYLCKSCNKIYASRGSLWKHSKTCKYISTDKETLIKESAVIVSVDELVPPSRDKAFTEDMVWELIQQNKDLQNVLVEQNNKLMEVSKHTNVVQNNTTTNNTTNNHQFNLNFFLNEQCKDAVNLIDFVNSLQLQINDLEKTGNLGYVEGISRIFLKGLQELDIYARPIHCTDLKRETVYVKDQDMWEKDNADKTKLKQVVNQIASKNLRQLPIWQQQHPEFRQLDTKENDTFMKIAIGSVGGQDEEEQSKYVDKIIKIVLKDVAIEKNMLRS